MLHFMLDAYDSVEEHANNLMAVNELLVKISASLKLKPVMPPFLLPYYYSTVTEDGGISAFCLCEGGHVTIHTFPYRSCYFLDIVSNSFFSISTARELIEKKLYASNIKTYSVDRRFFESIPDIKSIDENIDFGPHYMITVENVDMTLDSIYKWLDELPPKINMEAITRPYVIYSTVNNPKYVSGIVLVAQSHVAVHYNIEDKIAFIDIFSCSFLKNEQINKVLNDTFGDNVKYKLFVRGSKYGDSYLNENLRKDVYNKWKKDKLQ